MVTAIRTGAVVGIEGFAVTVEVDISRGLPGFYLVGLPTTAVKESRERVLAALRHSGIGIPSGKVVVNLAPAGIRKEGAAYDLAIALGVVAAQEPTEATTAARDAVVLGELSLFGDVRPVRGLLAIVLDAAARGERRVVVPACQVGEAGLSRGIDVVGVATLADAVHWWRTGVSRSVSSGAEPDHRARSRLRPAPPAKPEPGAEITELAVAGGLDLRELVPSALARQAAAIAAAGHHNLLLIGPPGAGKTRLARLVGALQPALTRDEGLEVTRIHGAAGILPEATLVRRRPFRAPHHTTTRAGLIGGGAALRPGEVTLAHRGTLFLDEVAEFAPAVLDALREPLEDGRVTITRGSGTVTFPARFQLLAAMNPCRCGYLGSSRRSCGCSAAEVRRYRTRLSGPLLDRFDICVEMPECVGGLLLFTDPDTGQAPGPASGPLSGGGCRSSRSAAVPETDNAGATADWRNGSVGTALPAAQQLLAVERGLPPDVPAPLLTRLRGYGLTDTALAHLDGVRVPLGLSIRGVLRCARVARTIAALDRTATVTASHISEALTFRREALAAFQPADSDML